MSNPETPKPIEKQRELYKLPKEEINWAALPAGSVEIETSLDHALRKILTPPNWNTLPADGKESVRKKVSLQIAGIEAKAVRAGFDASFARRGDKVTLEGGVLYLDLKREKKAYAVKLAKEANIKAGYREIKPEVKVAPSGRVNEVASLRLGLVVKSRRAWESLKEALEHGVVSEILTVLAGGNRRAGEFENRVRIWKEVMGREGEFRGTAEQNRAIVEYVKGEVAAGLTPDITPKPAPPEEEKTRGRGRRRKETKAERARRKGNWPAEDAYLKYLREHPRAPETPDPLEEALHKVTVLLGPQFDALNQKIDEYEELVERAKRNMRGGAADARITRGSIRAATEKAGELKEAIFQFKRKVEVLAKTLGDIETKDRERVERTKQSLQETKTSLDEQYQLAAQMEKELLEFLKRTLLPPSSTT